MTISAQEALNLIAQGDYIRAQANLKKLIALFPDQDELYNLYGYCTNCIEDICEKEDFDEPAVAPKPQARWEEWRQMAGELADKKEYDKASNLLGLVWDGPEITKPHPYAPYSPQPRTLLLQDRAVCRFLMEDKAGAKHNYLHAVKVELDQLHPDDPKRIRHLLKIKKYDEAFRLFDLAISTCAVAERARFYYERSQVHTKLGHTGQAAADLQAALNQLEKDIIARPLHYNLYYTHAAWLIEQGHPDQALFENAKAIALWPNYYGYHLQRAEIYARLGKSKQALEKLALIERGNLYRLASCRAAEKAKIYELLGDISKAEELYRIRDIIPGTHYDNLCDFYKRQGRPDDIAKTRQGQRQEKHFRDRVSERELIALF